MIVVLLLHLLSLLPFSVGLRACLSPRCRARCVRVCAAAPTGFELSVDLGDGGGVVAGELTAFFSHSELVIVRYPVPVILSASPENGVIRVYEDGHGLRVGDVLRACSTLLMRYCSEARAVRLGAGVHGRKRAARRSGDDDDVIDSSRSGARSAG